jgi:hypothetical protein
VRNIMMRLVAGCVLVACASGFAFATDRHVPAPYPTIQAGVSAALEGDTVIVADGVYSGVGNKNVAVSQAITIRSANGPEGCIIDCENDGRAFRLGGVSGATVIDGFTIQNGYVEDFGGGGVLCFSCNTLTVTNCRFVNNVALGGYPWDYGTGGALHVRDSKVTVKRCQFSGNQARWGGGIYINNFDYSPLRTGQLVDCEFSVNTATYMGGAVYARNADVWAVNSLLASNAAGWYGGAVYCEGTVSGLFLDFVTIADNAAGWYGGGLYFYNGVSPRIRNSIVAFNSAPYGSQMALEDSSVAHVLSSDFYGTLPIYVSGASFVDWVSGNINADPSFVDAAAGNYRLLSGSPCVDAGDNTILPQDTFDLDGDGTVTEELSYDLDNGWRVEDDPNTPDTGNSQWYVVDMGAYEWSPYPVGDLNCDRQVDFDDINPFVLAIADPLAYQLAYGGCALRNRDINGDGYVNFGDINPFVALLSGGY